MKIQIKKTFHLLLLFIGMVTGAIIIRVFFIDSFKVPTPSMEPAISSGDYIIVNKMIPGPRIFKNFNFLKNKERPDLYRIGGFRQIKRNDILVFNFPYVEWDKLIFDINICYVKRCVALPGDTFYIRNGFYRVDGVEEVLGDISQQEEFVEILKDEENIYEAFPHHEAFGWNVRNFGPLYVPQKDGCIRLDVLNVSLYKKIIEYENNGHITVDNSIIYLNDSIIDKYIFKTNYYFMVGDLVKDSEDSRYWGLLPEDHIIGRAEFIWKSMQEDSKKYNWKRFFKRLK